MTWRTPRWRNGSGKLGAGRERVPDPTETAGDLVGSPDLSELRAPERRHCEFVQRSLRKTEESRLGTEVVGTVPALSSEGCGGISSTTAPPTQATPTTPCGSWVLGRVACSESA